LGNQSAENTGNVTRSEGDGELLRFGVFILGLGEDVSIEGFDGSFEGDELHDSVGDLSGPKGGKTLVETISSFISSDLAKSFKGASGEGSLLGGLDSDLNGFPWAEKAISNNFCGG